MSFTTGTLLLRESVVLAVLHHEVGDWDAARDQVIADNRLQMRTHNASVRVCREVISRLKQLTPIELAIVHDAPYQEQAYVLWLAVCKRYRFIYAFAVEVIREKYLHLDFALTRADYDAFFNAKADWHPEVAGVAPSTREKQRQVVFKMLREADLASHDNRILPALLTPRLVEAIRHDDPAHFALFPISALDVKGWRR